MYFHPKMAWPPSIYDVISRNHSNWPSRNLSQNVRKGWTNSYCVRCWCFILWEKKKLKTSVGVVGGGERVASNRRWVPVFCFTQFGGAFPCLNFSKLYGTSPLIRFFYPSIAIRYTKSNDLITEESIALITTNRTLTVVCSTVSSARNCSGRLIYSMWMFLNLSLT